MSDRYGRRLMYPSSNYTMQDSKSNWLEGWLLMNCECKRTSNQFSLELHLHTVYLIIAVAFWYYPSANTAEARLLVC